MIGALRDGLAADLRELQAVGPRAMRGYAAALSVVLAVLVALALGLPDAWWAAISGLMCSQATAGDSLRRTALRIVGTVAGAGLSLMLASTLAYDHVLGAVCMLGLGTVGTLGFMLSRYGYAWLLGSITALMVVLSSLQEPAAAFGVATNRSIEVGVGSLVALVVAWLLVPEGDAALPPAPGFTDLLGANWPVLLHALRSGITVMLLPLVWIALDLPSLTQMAVTVSAVMAATQAGNVADPTAIVARALQRMIGCLLGGVAGLLLLSLPLTNFFAWLGLLAAGIFVCMHVQTTARGHGYVGTQAAIVFIITMVQGHGPPDSILPGIERLVGIVGGLAVLLVVSLLLWPEPDAQAETGTV